MDSYTVLSQSVQLLSHVSLFATPWTAARKASLSITNSRSLLRCMSIELVMPILLRVPWTARRSNQSILKEISPGCSLQGLMLKLKLQSFGHLMRRADSLEKTLMLGKIEGRRRRERQDEMVGWHHRVNGHGFGWTPGVVMDREAWRAAVHGVAKSQHD